ncbi:DUF6809 family protein [Oscillospiraceae bacterium PP1C4]
MSKSKSTLTDLYNGELYPAETIPADSKEYQRQDAAIHKAFLDLHKTLSNNQILLLEAYLENRSEATKIELESTFAEGFKLGAKIMMEVVSGNPPSIKNINLVIREGKKDDTNNNAEGH